MSTYEDIIERLQTEFDDEHLDAGPTDNETYVWWLEAKYVQLVQELDLLLQNTKT